MGMCHATVIGGVLIKYLVARVLDQRNKVAFVATLGCLRIGGPPRRTSEFAAADAGRTLGAVAFGALGRVLGGAEDACAKMDE